ncbi:MAG: hypothetical protein K2K44_06330 [Oscillospiraceae bacterium]|nr:hypothetical protein [Oscillospiraceae bacterium]
MNKIRIAIVFIFLAIAGVVLTVSGIGDIIKINGEIPDFNYESMQNVKNGDFVCGYVNNIFDCYASETTTNTTMGIETSSRTSEEYFLMPLINETDEAEDLYVTISASNIEDRELLYAIRNDTWEYMDGNTDIEFTEMAILARVKKIDDDLMPLLIDWFQEIDYCDGNEVEIRKHILPYEFVVYRNPNAPYISLIVGLIMIAVVAVAGFFVVRTILPKKVETAPYIPPADASENTAENSFAEAYTTPQPLPNISQPVQPDDFFPAPKPKSETETKPNPEPKNEPPKPVSVNNYEDTNLDTSGMNAEQDLYEQEQAIAANVRHVEYDNQLETSDLDTDKKLAEQEQAIAANARHIEYDNQLETDHLDTDQKLYEQEQAIAANARQVDYDNQLETSDLDTDRQLTEQEQAIAANTRKMEYDNEIDTSDLNTDSLDYYDTSAQGEDDDIFIFSNDFDYETDASNIEISD